MPLSSEHLALLKRMSERNENEATPPNTHFWLTEALETMCVDCETLDEHNTALGAAGDALGLRVLSNEQTQEIAEKGFAEADLEDETLWAIFGSATDLTDLHSEVYGEGAAGNPHYGRPSVYWLGVIDRISALKATGSS